MKGKIYEIEEKHDYWGTKYRFRSLYNGATGCWNSYLAGAVIDGDKHQKIIYDLFGKKNKKEVK